MTNAFPPRSPAGSLRSKKTSGPRPVGEAELLALFQLIPIPALLLEMPQEQIVFANGALLQLTAFSLNEIVGRKLRSLIEGLPEHELAAVIQPAAVVRSSVGMVGRPGVQAAAEDILNVSLQRRGRPPLEVNVQVRPLDAAGSWLALTIEMERERTRSWISRMDQVGRVLAELNQARQEQSIRQNLERGLAAVRDLLGVGMVAVYQLRPDGLEVVKTAEVGGPIAENQKSMVSQNATEGLLPDHFAAIDMPRLARTYLWQPGRRVQTELHRVARIHNLSLLGSTPLRVNGLLVVGDRLQEPSDSLMVAMEALGEQVSGMLEHLNQLNALSGKLSVLQRELGIWQSVGENAQEGILLLDPDGSVVQMNLAAEWMLGYASWEAKGQPVENILIGPERLAQSMETAAQGIPTHNMGNVALHRRNGQSFPAHIQVIPVEAEPAGSEDAGESTGGDPSGDASAAQAKTAAILIFFSDVSEHVEIRNRTQQLEQRAVLGEVTAVFAHEVRNPINNISTGLQLLSVKLPENDPNQENISRLLNDCQRLDHLMESVLNFSKHVEHKFEEVDLEVLLRRLLDRWRPRMAKANVTAFFQAEENTPHVLADPRSLEQVFTNLIGNAIDAMDGNKATGQMADQQTGEKAGTLSVRIAPFRLLPSRPQVEVSVSDNGPGIPDGIRERIFEPFVTTKQQGTGLGLAISKRIVTAHHGSMNVNSFPGGTVFQVYLSAYQAEPAQEGDEV